VVDRSCCAGAGRAGRTSSAGTRLALVVLRAGRLYVISLDGSRPVRLTKERIYGSIGGSVASVSPDGRFRRVLAQRGHVFDELEGAERLSAEQAIRKARAEARATLVRPAPDRVAQKKNETPGIAGLS
jgi:hypothetical protein